MHKNRLLKWLLAPFFIFVDDDGTGGGADRGDNFVPTDDDDGKAAKAALDAKEAADKAAKEAADKAAADEAAAEKEAADKEAADKAAADKAATDKEAAEKGKKDSRIPLSRHEQILAKERERREALETELAKVKKGEETAQVNDVIAKAETKVDELQAQYDKEIADGNLDKAKTLMKELRTLERNIADQKAEIKAVVATETAVETMRYDIVVDRIEAAYPEMDPKHEDFDREKMLEVLELKEAYGLKGYKPSAALQKAVNIILGAATGKQKTATEVKPKVDEAAAAAAAKKEGVKEAATKTAIDAVNKQPPATGKIGVEHDKAGGVLDAKKVMSMNQEEFAKIDERELARMRGDDL